MALRHGEVLMFENYAPENDVESFCRRWKKEIFAFCQMSSADAQEAEVTAIEVLVLFSRGQNVSLREDKIRPRLLSLALEVSRKRDTQGAHQKPVSGRSRLEDALQKLPRVERAV